MAEDMTARGMDGISAQELLGPLNDVERKYAPARLFVAGDHTVLQRGPRVAVIGSRKASPSGLSDARQIAEMLVARGMVVVSGLADGIDTIAHQTVLAANGKTIAVLGTPLDQYYPAQNRQLQDRLMREQLVISQFASGSPVDRGNFPMRNRTLALLSHASIIVEAGNKSGSLYQGWEALRLGRPLIILSAVAENPRLTWPAEMVEYGAIVLPPSRLHDVLDLLPSPDAELGLDAARREP
jgi:DNA processing protein